MKIALVHDWLVRLGGAERVLIALRRIFPEAPVYTLFYDKKFVAGHLPGVEIRPSFLQKIPNIKKTYPWFKILMPVAIESLDFSKFDLVISSSHEVAHGLIVKPGTKHIAYYHSPSRLLWDRAYEYLEDFRKRKNDPVKLSLIRAGQHFLRLWDWSAGKRPDVMVANSNHVAERIKKYYGREARVIYPSVEVLRGSNSSRSFSGAINYFLIVSQLYPHKNLDLAVRTFKKMMEFNLVIVGQGPERKRIQRLIGDSANIKLPGFVSDEELPHYYKNCLAYLICNEEDFGISPVEAMMHGKPVLALGCGGALETVKEGVTGEFFYPVRDREGPQRDLVSNGVDGENEKSLAEAARSLDEKIRQGRYESRKIAKHAERFGFERFKKEILEIVQEMG